MASAPAAAAAVEKFLAENPVDPRAGQSLRNASPEVQLQAMERGSLQDCKNPSAALMVRINGSQANSSSTATSSAGGLSSNEMKGTPEEVWARIMAKNKAGTSQPTGGYGGYGADPTSMLMAQQMAAQQQALALHLYYQQLAAQQAYLAAAQPALDPSQLAAAGLGDPALQAVAGGSLPSSAPVDYNQGAAGLTGTFPGMTALQPVGAALGAELYPGQAVGMPPPGGMAPPPGQALGMFPPGGPPGCGPGFMPSKAPPPFSPVAYGACGQPPPPPASFGKSPGGGYGARPAPY